MHPIDWAGSKSAPFQLPARFEQPNHGLKISSGHVPLSPAKAIDHHWMNPCAAVLGPLVACRASLELAGIFFCGRSLYPPLVPTGRAQAVGSAGEALEVLN
jgi:hypothetical protein